jgi:holin-like protein
MLGLAILVLFYFAGVALHDYARVPLPGNVLGMLLLFAALCLRLVKLRWVEGAAGVLLRNMMLFFVPVIVSVMGQSAALQANWLPVLGGMTASTFVTMAVAGWTGRLLLRKPAEGTDGR